MPPSQINVPDNLILTSDSHDMLALKGAATPPAAIIYAPSSAITDADLSANTLAPSIDETAAALLIRAEYADGTTLKTAVIPFQPASTITVGATGADFTTIQAAWNSLRGRLLQSAVTIAVQSGTYTEAVTLSLQPFSSLITIQGDTRTAAGQHFVTTGSITKAGSDCTITLTATPPSDFTSSDFVVIGGTASAGNVGRFPIVSINTGSKTVTYTNASGVAEAVRSDTQVIFCPDRIINFTGLGNGVRAGTASAPTFSGFTLLSTSTGITALLVAGPTALSVKRCVVFGIDTFGFQSSDGGNLVTDANCAAVKCTYGFIATRGGYLAANSTYSSDNTSFGYISVGSAIMNINSIVATNNNIGVVSQDNSAAYVSTAVSSFGSSHGYLATNNGFLFAQGSTARNNVTGYGASWNSLVVALSTNANNSGNTTNYSPATSGTPGNFDGLTNWS